MGAIFDWKIKVARCQQAHQSSEQVWWNQRSIWYAKWAKDNNYAGVIYPKIKAYVSGACLEIGSGTGAFTELLVKDADIVTALEPSDCMGRILHERFFRQMNLRVLPMTVEEYLHRTAAPQFHYVLAANSLYHVEPIDRVIDTLMASAHCFTIIIGTRKRLEWSRVIKREFSLHHKVEAPPPTKEDLVGVLEELGYPYTSMNVTVPNNYLFNNRAELLDWCVEYYGIPEIRRPELMSFLEPYLTVNEHKIGLYNQREWGIINIFQRFS